MKENAWTIFITAISSGALIQFLNWLTDWLNKKSQGTKSQVEAANSNVDMALKLRDEAAESYAEMRKQFDDYTDKSQKYIIYLEQMLKDNGILFEKTHF